VILPGYRAITIEQGATFREGPITLLADGLPVNATDWTLLAQMWNSRKTTVLATFEVEWIDRANGKFTLMEPDEDTAALTKSGVWDLLVTYGNGESDYWLAGPAYLARGGGGIA
jgi:hypothetical protein